MTNVGIVGCGWVGQEAYLPLLSGMSEVRIAAVYDSDKNLAERVARKYNVPCSFNNFKIMLDKGHYDLIVLCSYPQEYYQYALEAISRGIHLVIEKPMAVDSSQAAEMIRAAQTAGTIICPVKNFIFDPLVIKARKMVECGGIGKLLSARVQIMETPMVLANKKEHWSHSLPGGRFADLAQHAIYLLKAFLGETNEISACASKLGAFDWMWRDELRVTMLSEKGLGEFAISFNWPRHTFIVELTGSSADIEIDIFAMSMLVRRPVNNKVAPIFSDKLRLSRDIFWQALSARTKYMLGRRWYCNGHSELLRLLVQAINNGGDSPVEPGSGLKDLQVYERILEQII